MIIRVGFDGQASRHSHGSRSGGSSESMDYTILGRALSRDRGMSICYFNSTECRFASYAVEARSPSILAFGRICPTRRSRRVAVTSGDTAEIQQDVIIRDDI